MSTSDANNAAIRKQIEYYFGNSNLRRDRFLKQKIAEDKEGWVGVDVLLTFNRLKALTEDPQVIKAALEGSELVEVSEDATKLRRSTEMPDVDDSIARTVYAKGLPLEGTTIDTVEKLFAPHGKIASIKLRRHYETKDFKGSVFIEFETEADAEAACAQNGQIKVEGAEEPLLVLKKQDYFDKKKEERREARKRKRDDGEDDGEDNAGEEKKDYGFKWQPGLIVKVEGLVEGTTREDLKAAYEEGLDGQVKFVDYSMGKELAHLRMESPEDAKKVLENTAQVREVAPKLSLLEGEEEEAYWKKVEEIMMDHKKNKRQKKGFRGRGRGRRR